MQARGLYCSVVGLPKQVYHLSTQVLTEKDLGPLAWFNSNVCNSNANSWQVLLRGTLAHRVVRTDDTWWILMNLLIFHQFSSKDHVYKKPSKRLQNPSKRLQKPSNAYKSQKVGQMGFPGIWKNMSFSVWPLQKFSLEQALQECLAARVSPTFPRTEIWRIQNKCNFYSFTRAIIEQF